MSFNLLCFKNRFGFYICKKNEVPVLSSRGTNMNIELNDLKMAIKMRFASVWQTVDGKVVSFDSVFEEALNCLSEFGMFRALKSEQKEAISSLVSG